MLSNYALAVVLVLIAGGAIVWLVAGFERLDRQLQITQAIAALDRLADFWRAKLDEEHLGTYANTKLRFIAADRDFLLKKLDRLKAGSKLTVSELVRVENLVSDYRREDPAHFMVPSSNLEATN